MQVFCRARSGVFLRGLCPPNFEKRLPILPTPFPLVPFSALTYFNAVTQMAGEFARQAFDIVVPARLALSLREAAGELSR